MIRNLPSRYPELGRIRLGEKFKTKNGKEAPRKGEFLRFTSNDEVVLKAIASQLGGDVEAWEDGEQTWQLTSESDSVPVFLPPEPIDTSYERWGSGGIQKRCDGERCLRPVTDGEGGYLEEVGCLCIAENLVPGDRDDMKKGACQVTVRLRLVLPQVPGIGVWMCTSHSIYAAMELPGQVELLQAITSTGGGAGRLIPAEFAIDKRSEKKPWEKFARDFIVPVLRVRASLAQLAAGDIPAGMLEAAAPALPAAEPATTPPPPSAAPPSTPPSAAAGPAREEETVPPRAASSSPPATEPSPFVRTVTMAGKRAGLEGDEFDGFVRYAIGKGVEAIDSPEDGNAVFEALKRFQRDEIRLAYTPDGTPTFAEPGQAALDV